MVAWWWGWGWVEVDGWDGMGSYGWYNSLYRYWDAFKIICRDKRFT